jgi:hypothetical protein
MSLTRFANPGTVARHLARREDPVRAVAKLVEQEGLRRIGRLSCARFKKTPVQASISKLRARDEDSKKVTAEDTEIAKFFGENERNFRMSCVDSVNSLQPDFVPVLDQETRNEEKRNRRELVAYWLPAKICAVCGCVISPSVHWELDEIDTIRPRLKYALYDSSGPT